MCFVSLFKDMKLIMNFVKKVPSVMSLLAHIVFNGSTGMKDYTHWTY